MKLSSFLLRLGLAFSFAYAAADSFIKPDNWIGFFPLIIRSLMAPSLLLLAFALLQAGLAFWLISGKAVFYSASLSALLLFGIIIVNLGQFEIIFRDVTILFAALALAARNIPSAEGMFVLFEARQCRLVHKPFKRG